MKKTIALLLVLILGISLLAACGGGGSGGGSGDALKGTWTGLDDNGMDASFIFDGKGGLKFGDSKDSGTYTITGSEVSIKVDWWDNARSYTFAINGNNLTLTRPETAYYVNFDLTKK